MSTNCNQTLHAEISIVPVGTGSTSISKEVAAAFEAIRKTKDINTTKLTAMGTQIEARNMRPILNAIEAAHGAVKSTGAKRIISIIRYDASSRLEDEIESVTSANYSFSYLLSENCSFLIFDLNLLRVAARMAA